MTHPLFRISKFILVMGLFFLTGCARRTYIVLVTATPVIGSQPQEPSTIGGESGQGDESPEATQIPVPLVPQYAVTPNATRVGLPDPVEEDLYVVQPGDTLQIIADGYGVTLDALRDANELLNENILSVGQVLLIPLGVSHQGPDSKLIPDSELVYGPGARDMDVIGFVESQSGHLATYSEEIEGLTMTGAQIVDRVALETSVNPRLLLALLEYESRWVTGAPANEFERIYPMNYLEQNGRFDGLYKQLGWAANHLNAGYYGWKQQGLWAGLLADGTRVAYAPTLNAGTVGVQNLLAHTRGWTDWQHAVSYEGFWQTYAVLFGDPFQYNYDPLMPSDLSQPEFSFPWAPGEAWYYTGGPHGGWASGTPWAAVDFATGDQGLGCYISEAWARAVTDGVVARSEPGVVVLDVDGDGFEGTGWTVFYLHIDSQDRAVQEGSVVKRGDPIGHPSCEGGFSNATHLHIARRFNGEWIAADCRQCLAITPVPALVFSGWSAFTFESEYDGSFVNGDSYREARQLRDSINELIYYE